MCVLLNKNKQSSSVLSESIVRDIIVSSPHMKVAAGQPDKKPAGQPIAGPTRVKQKSQATAQSAEGGIQGSPGLGRPKNSVLCTFRFV